jgi:hypothetical protein
MNFLRPIRIHAILLGLALIGCYLTIFAPIYYNSPPHIPISLPASPSPLVPPLYILYWRYIDIIYISYQALINILILDSYKYYITRVY